MEEDYNYKAQLEIIKTYVKQEAQDVDSIELMNSKTLQSVQHIEEKYNSIEKSITMYKGITVIQTLLLVLILVSGIKRKYNSKEK